MELLDAERAKMQSGLIRMREQKRTWEGVARVIRAAAIGALMWSSMAAAQTITIGKTATTGGASEDFAGNDLFGYEVTLTQTATIESLCIYISAYAQSFKVRLGIYSNSGSAPASLLAWTDEITVSSAGWKKAPVTSPVQLSAGTYWLAWVSNNTNSSNNIYIFEGVGRCYYRRFTYAPLPSSFGGSADENQHISFYAILSLSTGKTTEWTGSSSTAWATADNWQNGVPTSGDVVLYNTNSTQNYANQNNNIYSLSNMVIRVLNPAGDVGISSGNSIGLAANGIDMSSASDNLSIAVGLSFGGAQTWNVNSGRTLTVSGVCSGSSALTKSGSGTLTLSGANSYSGGTTLSAGTLNINSATALGTGTFTISGGTIDNTSGGSITISNNNAQSWNGDFTFTGSNALNMGMGAVTLGGNRTVTVSATTLTVGGVISGGYSLTKAGAGTLTLSGANTYTGATTVSAGTLSLTGSVTSNTSVSAGATLAGTGTVSGTITLATGSPGGTLSPGTSATPATLTTSGATTMNSGSVFSVDIAGNGNNDKLSRSGANACNLNGATLSINLAYAPSVGHSYTIIDNTNASGSISGQFSCGTQITAQYSGTTYYFSVNYNGGNGNDVVLTNISVVTPINMFVDIKDNSGYTNDATPRVEVRADSCDSIWMVANNDTNTTPAYRYIASFPVYDSVDISLPGEGKRYVRVKFKNRYGNATGWVSDSTIYDITEPISAVTTAGSYNSVSWGDTIRGTYSDGGIIASGVQSVNLQIRRGSSYYNGNTWQDAPVEVPALISNGVWKYYLPDSRLTDALYTILCRARDVAGNSQASWASGGFHYDNTAPSASIFIVDSGGYTSDPTPLVRIDTTGWADSMKLTADTSAPPAAFKQFSRYDSSVTFGAEGRKFVFVKLKDNVGNTSGWLRDSTMYDYTAPVCRIATSGAYNAESWPGHIEGTAYDMLSGVRKVDICIQRMGTGYWNGTNWLSPAPVWFGAVRTLDSAWSYALSFASLIDGSYTVQAWATDSAYNSFVANGSFVFSNTGPSGAQISITEMVSGFTSDPDPRLILSVANPVKIQMRIALTTDTAHSAWKPFAQYDSIRIDSPPTDHGVRIWVQFRDSVGNRSPWVSDSTTYDATAPQAWVTTAGTFNAATWTGVVVGEARDATSGIDSVYVAIRRIGVNRFWSGTAWVEAAEPLWLLADGKESWSISLTNIQDDRYEILVRAIDRVGNRQSISAQGTFGYDATPPSGGQVLIIDHNGVTNDPDPPLRITVSGDKVQMRIAATGADTTAWKAYQLADSINISANGDGFKRVYVQFRDSVGNLSSWVYDSTLYDATPPFSSIGISGTLNPGVWKDSIRGSAGDAASGVESVLVSIFCDTIARYWNGLNWVSAEVWIVAGGTTDWFVYLPKAQMRDSRYTVRCRATDRAGNVQVVASTREFFFRLPPTAAFGVGSSAVMVGNSVQFFDSSDGVATSWLWQFGDGTTSQERNPVHVYRDTGSKTVTLTVDGPGGSSSVTKEACVFVYREGQNPVRISGKYLGPSSVEIKFENLHLVDRDFPPPWADSLYLYACRGTLPTEPRGPEDSLVTAYSFAAIVDTGGRYIDTVHVLPLSSGDSTYGFMTSLIWIGDAPSAFRPENGALVLMRDTTRAVNPLFFDDTASWRDSVLTVYVNGVDRLDTSIVSSVLIWYGFSATAAYATTNGVSLGRTDVEKASVAGRFSWTVTNKAFDDVRKTVYVFALVQAPSGRYSVDTAKAAYFVGVERPKNNVVLRATAIGSDAIKVSWSGGVQYDSLKLWYGTVPVPLSHNISQTSGLYPLLYGPRDTVDTVSGLAPSTLYYFGMQACKGKLWSVVTEYSSGEEITWAADTLFIKNTIEITRLVFDTATHAILIYWKVDTTNLTTLQFGVSYGIGASNETVPLKWTAVLGLENETALTLNETLVFDTTYYVSMWLRRSGGAPAAPTALSQGTVRIPGFSWQKVSTFGFSDTVYCFNGQVLFINAVSGTGAIPADTIDYFQPEAAKGFVPVSIGFSFRSPEQTPPLDVGLTYRPFLIPKGYKATDIRIYRQDPQGLWYVERDVVIDTVNRLVLMRLDASRSGAMPLSYPFIAMIDTLAPVCKILSDSASIIGLNIMGDVYDTIFVHDNTSNVRWFLRYCRGSDNVFLGAPKQADTLAAPADTLHLVVPASGAEDNGLRILFFFDDGLHAGTIDLSRRALCMNNEEVTPAMQWYPLHVTVNLFDSTAESVFGNSVSGTWKYDSTMLRLFRFVTYDGNKAAPYDKRWAEYSFAPDSLFQFSPGRLFWVKSRNLFRISFGGGITPSLKDTVVMKLPPRQWTDLAVPYSFDMRLRSVIGGVHDSLEWYRWEKTVESGDVDSTFYSVPLFLPYLPAHTKADTVVLRSASGEGYTVLNWSHDTITIKFPAVPSAMSDKDGTLAGLQKEADAQYGGWLVRIDARCAGGGELTPLFCGMREDYHGVRLSPLPPSFGTVRLGLVGGADDKNLHVCALSGRNDRRGYSFELALSNSGNRTRCIKLSISPSASLPAQFRVAVFNPKTREYEVPDSGAYSIEATQASMEYRWLVIGDGEFFERFRAGFPAWRLGLLSVYPNPFRDRVAIRYSIPYPGVKKLTFSIYDMRGRCVWRRQLDRSIHPGAHVLVWNARTTAKSALASGGRYVIRMTAVDYANKMRCFSQVVVVVR